MNSSAYFRVTTSLGGFQNDQSPSPARAGLPGCGNNLLSRNGTLVSTTAYSLGNRAEVLHTATVHKRAFARIQPLLESPYIYERDELPEDESSYWKKRIAMIDEAYRCATIISLSIVPTNPSVPQTWYYNNSYAYDLTKTTPTYVDTDFCDTPAPLYHAPTSHKIGGYIKPFHSYSSEKFPPRFELNEVQPIYLRSAQDSVDELPPFYEEILASIRNIADAFLQDPEARIVGLTLHADIYDPDTQLFFAKA